jgi:hypothetical protein
MRSSSATGSKLYTVNPGDVTASHISTYRL